MPCVSQFYGIAIYMYYNDHAPPHFHAEYAGDEVLIEINSLNIYAGSLPRRAYNLTIEWAEQSRVALLDDWHRARQGEPLLPIKPLE